MMDFGLFSGIHRLVNETTATPNRNLPGIFHGVSLRPNTFRFLFSAFSLCSFQGRCLRIKHRTNKRHKRHKFLSTHGITDS